MQCVSKYYSSVESKTCKNFSSFFFIKLNNAFHFTIRSINLSLETQIKFCKFLSLQLFAAMIFFYQIFFVASNAINAKSLK